MWLLTLVVVALPALGPRLLRLRSTGQRREPAPPFSHRALALVSLYAVVELAGLVRRLRHQVDPLAGLPLLAVPLSVVRTRVPPPLARKLEAFDGRTTYGRFGPGPLLACAWCQLPATPPSLLVADHGLFHLLGLATEAALGPALVWALLTEHGQRRRWRPLGLGLLALATLAEAVYTTTATVSISGGGDGRRLFVLLPPLRTLFHLVLPFLLLVLPGPRPSPPPPARSLPPLLTSASHLLSTVKLLELALLALARQPALARERTLAGRQLHDDAALARADAAVRAAGEQVGLTADDDVPGGLREGARRFLTVARANVQRSLLRRPTTTPTDVDDDAS